MGDVTAVGASEMERGRGGEGFSINQSNRFYSTPNQDFLEQDSAATEQQASMPTEDCMGGLGVGLGV